jgi:cysteine desulfurase
VAVRVYCDHAATTPLCDEAWRALEPFLRERFGNASEPHAEGRAARAGLTAARELAAATLGTTAAHVVFTSGGSESDNLAVLGRLAGAPGRVVTTALEHAAVGRAAAASAGELVLAPVAPDGVVQLVELVELVQPGDRLCAVIWASNLTGALQPVHAIAELCAARGVPLHLDAVQAAAWLPLRIDELPGEVTVAVSGHKLGGPKGSGLLAGRGIATLAPVLHGGGQERGLRPGTENVAHAAGLAAALAARHADGSLAVRTCALRDALETRLQAELTGLEVAARAVERLPGHSLLLLDGLRGDALCALLDDAGIAVSAGSACHSAELEPSDALAAMGISQARALGALRISLGAGNTAAEIDRLADAIAGSATALRAAGAVVGA